MPPHTTNSKPSTPASPPSNNDDLPGKDAVNSIKINGAPSRSLDRAEKDRTKNKDKKDKKDRERVERDERDRERNDERDVGEPLQPPPLAQAPESGKSTPIPEAPAPDPVKENETDLKSPATESSGVRTPTTRKPPRNPWTLFMRISVAVNEAELREFFGEAKSGVS
jgi:hypothetical protein